MISFSDLTEEIPDNELPLLDRKKVDEAQLNSTQIEWRYNGTVLLKKFMPEELIAQYCAIREQLNEPGGWRYPTPYMDVPEIKDICLYEPLQRVLRDLIGDEMGLHLNLTGWVSTERNWHQDAYLNPEFINTHYVAVWMALDKIHPDSGPFEWIPGSHRWPLVRRHKIFKYLTGDECASDRWPTIAERFVNPAFEAEIAARGVASQKFLGDRGDVLIWHAALTHRGSYPNVKGTPRKALISHYSALGKRLDMPNRQLHDKPGSRGMFFVLNARHQNV